MLYIVLVWLFFFVIAVVSLSVSSFVLLRIASHFHSAGRALPGTGASVSARRPTRDLTFPPSLPSSQPRPARTVDGAKHATTVLGRPRPTPLGGAIAVPRPRRRGRRSCNAKRYLCAGKDSRCETKPVFIVLC